MADVTKWAESAIPPPRCPMHGVIMQPVEEEGIYTCTRPRSADSKEKCPFNAADINLPQEMFTKQRWVGDSELVVRVVTDEETGQPRVNVFLSIAELSFMVDLTKYIDETGTGGGIEVGQKDEQGNPLYKVHLAFNKLTRI